MVTRQSQEIVLTRGYALIGVLITFYIQHDEEAEIISYNDDDVLDNVKWGTDKL